MELLRFSPGQVICRQGDAADSFYLVRIGFVKVSEEHPGGELVLAYLARRRLLRRDRAAERQPAHGHLHRARSRRGGAHLGGEDFQLHAGAFPDIRRSLEGVQRTNASRRIGSATIRAENVPVDQFLAQGLMEAQSLLVLDLEKCTRCDQCVRACADAHDGVSRLVREGLRFDKYLVATSCRQCRDPLCMVGCPVGSIRRRNTLEVIIEDWCIGCGLCANNCPYGNINLHPFPAELDDPAHPGRKIASVQGESDIVRFVPRPRRAELCLCLSARRGASRESAGVFCQYCWRRTGTQQGQELTTRADRSHTPQMVHRQRDRAGRRTAVYIPLQRCTPRKDRAAAALWD